MPTNSTASDCDFYADVDFGRGPVEVRCTLRGEHIEHVCIVSLVKGESFPKQLNIFDQDAASQDLHGL